MKTHFISLQCVLFGWSLEEARKRIIIPLMITLTLWMPLWMPLGIALWMPLWLTLRMALCMSMGMEILGMFSTVCSDWRWWMNTTLMWDLLNSFLFLREWELERKNEREIENGRKKTERNNEGKKHRLMVVQHYFLFDDYYFFLTEHVESRSYHG